MKRMICCHFESLMHHPAQYNSILCEHTQPQHDIMSAERPALAHGDNLEVKHLYMSVLRKFLNSLG